MSHWETTKASLECGHVTHFRTIPPPVGGMAYCMTCRTDVKVTALRHHIREVKR